MGGVRFMLAGAILYTVVRLRGAARPKRIHWRNTAIVGALLVFAGNGSVVWTEQFVPSGLTALLVAVLPFWIAIVDWVRPGGTRPTLGVSVGLVIGMIGLVVLIGPSALDPSATSTAGDGVALKGAVVLMISSLLWAIGSIFSRDADMPSAFVATGMEMFLGGAMLFVLSLVVGEPRGFDITAVSRASLIGFIYLTAIGSLVGFTAFVWLLTVQPAARVATYAYVNPVVAVFLGWALAGEALSLRTAIAAAIIIGAVALITTARSSLPSRARAKP